jgi:hypothetical protein
MSGRRLASLGFCCSLLAGFSGLAGTWGFTRADEPEKASPPAEAQAAANAEPRPKYIRISRDEADEPLALQTAVVHFVPAEDSSTSAAKADLRVDLVGAVHVGEKSYYDALNKAFENYDVVLYELVAPEGTRVPKGGRSSGHPIALLQNGMKDMLGLEHQLQLVDYTKENMIHADMSPEDFSKSMEEREESFIGMFARMWGQAIAQQSSQKNRTSDFDVLAALFSSDRAGTMKRVMAEQFENVEGVMQALDGPDGSTIITERNKVALKKLAEQIAAGKKKIAIFYGAGHLGDMEKRLVSDFELKRSGEDWLDAWILTSTPKAKKPAAVKPAAEPAESPKKAA